MSVSKRIAALSAGAVTVLMATMGTASAAAPPPSVLKDRASAAGSIAEGSGAEGIMKVTTKVTVLDSGCYRAELLDTPTPDENSSMSVLSIACGEGSNFPGVPSQEEVTDEVMNPDFHYLRVCVVPGSETPATERSTTKPSVTPNTQDAWHAPEGCGNIVDLKS